MEHAYWESILGEKIEDVQSLSGGDISKAYRIRTAKATFFAKVHSESALPMFEAESKGLSLLQKHIATPKAIALGIFKKKSYLILEYIPTQEASKANMADLGLAVAYLHLHQSSTFGLDHKNYIGTLEQHNHSDSNWAQFFWKQRLLPQFNRAQYRGLLSSSDIPSANTFIEKIESFQVRKASLLHGDLWSGNYLIHTSGKPYIIDPAVYYGDPWVDIAMTFLFGGFADPFYKQYFTQFPKPEKLDDRINMYQLYYLLVHLNLFGTAYKASVIQKIASIDF